MVGVAHTHIYRVKATMALLGEVRVWARARMARVEAAMVGTLGMGMGMGMATPRTQDTVTAGAITAITAIIATTAKAAGRVTRIHTRTVLNLWGQGCPTLTGTLISAALAVMTRGTGVALTEVDMAVVVAVAVAVAVAMGSFRITDIVRCPDMALTDTL